MTAFGFVDLAQGADQLVRGVASFSAMLKYSAPSSAAPMFLKRLQQPARAMLAMLAANCSR